MKLKSFDFPSASSMKPVVILILLVFMIFILVGGIYDIIERPKMTLEIYPSLQSQWLNESVLIAFFLIIGISGGFITFQSRRYAYRPREAKMFLMIGISMLIMAFLGCEIALLSKFF